MALGSTTAVTLLGDTSGLQDELRKVGIVAGDMSAKVRGSVKDAGAAMADLARDSGASADEQADAAGRAAAAWTEMAAKMSSAQKAAGDAAAEAARVVGASLDEQSAAYDRSVASVGRYEAAQRAAADAAEEAAAKQKEARAGLAEFGGKVALGVTVGGGISAYEGVKGAMALQSQMERLHTQAGVSQANVAPMQHAVLGMAGQVGESPDQLAQGLYHVASQMNATLPPTQRMSTELKILKVAAEGARVGGADLTDVTNALGAAVVSGIKGVQNYRQAMGAMNATVGAGDMTMQDLADAFGTGVVVQAKNAGVSIQQLGGALAVLGDNNIRGARAGTLMASTLRIMKAPSEAATEALNAVGLSSTSLASALRSGGVEGALETLKQHLAENGAAINGTSAEMNRAGLIITRAFGGRQSAGVQDLLGQLDRLKAKTADVGNGMDTFGADVAKNNQTAQQEFDELKAHVAALGDEFGLYLIPKLEDVAHATADVIGWMERHKAEAESLAAVIGGVLGVAVAAYAYTKATAFINATKDMASGIGSFAKGAGSAAQTIAVKLGLIDSTAEATSTEFSASTTAMVADADAMETGVVASADGAAVGVDAALGSTGIGLIIVGLGLAATELATHWKTVMSVLKDATHLAAEAVDYDLNNQVIPVINDVIKALDDVIKLYDKIPGLFRPTGKIGTVGLLGNVDLAGNGSSGGSAGASAGSVNAATGAVDATGDPSLPGGSNESKIANYLAAQGLSKVAVAGILGNLEQEHGFQTSNVPINAAGDGGMGIAQWTGSRLTAEEAYANQHGLSPTSLAAQLGFMMSELHGGYSTTLTALQGATTPAQAAAIWDSKFEGGTDPGGIREQYAQQIYGQLGTSRTRPESPGLRSYLASGGQDTTTKAAATSTIPVAVATMLKTAQELEGTRYVWGGGHAGWDPVEELKKIGLDCSGFVSQVLHAGGVNLPGPENTGQLAGSLQKGAGKYVTVFDRASGSQAHTFMEIDGKYFMEGGNRAVNPNQVVTQLTAAQAHTELLGGGFQAYHPDLPGGGNVTGTSSSLQSALQDLAKEQQAYLKALASTGGGLLAKLQNDIQNGSIKSLESVLHVSTATSSPRIHQALTHLGASATQGQITRSLVPILTRNAPMTPAEYQTIVAETHASRMAGMRAIDHSHASAAQKMTERLALNARTEKWMQEAHAALASKGSRTGGEQKFDKLIATLQAAHTKALSHLADELIKAHKAALATLATEMYAQQREKDAEELQNQTTALNDQTQAIQDATQAMEQAASDQRQLMADESSAVVQHMQDMQQTVDDTMSGLATQIKDAAQVRSDQGQGTIDNINDQTQIQVDTLGERGLYGLNLIAQKLQVQLDVTKAYWDQILDNDKTQLDQLQQQADTAENSAQLNLDQVTSQQHLLVAQAQQNLDAVTMAQHARVAAAQAHADSVQLHADTTLVGPAQIALDMNANAPKATQDKFQSQLDYYTNLAGKMTAGANQQFQDISQSAQQIIDGASNTLQSATDNANQLIGAAQNSLSTITDTFTLELADANAKYSGDQTSAGIAEASLSGGVSIASAQASTEFAGSGTTIQIYGIPADNAAAIADAVAWQARTVLAV